MIKLNRRPTPDALAVLERSRERAAEHDARAEPWPEALRSAYRHRDVKQSLMAEVCDKCAYCESKIPHVYSGDVEHILPRRHRPNLALDYANLTLACARCNNAKRDYFDEAMPLVNPYEDDPSEFFAAAGPMLVRRGGSRRAQVTELTIDLNRDDLLDRRRDRLNQILPLVDQYHREENDSLKSAVAREIWHEAERCREYTFFVTAFLLAVGNIPKPADAPRD